jgi:hypothetical protein
MIFNKKRIIFLIRYPFKNDLNNGYFQRVLAIDNILSHFIRYYVNYDNKKIIPEIEKIKDKVFQINTSKYNPFGLLIIFIFTYKSKVIYSHSIINLRNIFHRLLFCISSKKILDIHGIVPEEFRINDDLDNYKKFNQIEKFAVNNASILIGVTEQMVTHVINKYYLRNKKIIILPILPKIKEFSGGILKKNLKSVIYCGGLQKWQQVDKMLDYVYKNNKKYSFAFLVPDTNKLIMEYKIKYNNKFPGIVESAESNIVNEWYEKYSFGLVLREDIIVNNVACPTKLIEYLQNDVVPIIDTSNIGDFKKLGYAYVEYGKELPNQEEWIKMIKQNREVLKNIYNMFKKGLNELKEGI